MSVSYVSLSDLCLFVWHLMQTDIELQYFSYIWLDVMYEEYSWDNFPLLIVVWTLNREFKP